MGSTKSKATGSMNSSSSSSSFSRRAYHAGSWYDADKELLDATLTKFMTDAAKDENPCNNPNTNTPRACICPHAGFSYSGPTAAYSFLALEEALKKNQAISTIVVLHPSHHVYLQSCAM